MWLGIDIGTGGSRALLVDENGVVKGSDTAAHADMTMHQPLWAEQDPDDWRAAMFDAFAALARDAPAALL